VDKQPSTAKPELLSWRINYEKEFFDKRAHEFAQSKELYLKRDYSGAFKFLGIAPKDIVDKKVLDCGCGVGDLSLWLALNGAKVCSIDVSPQSLEVVQKRAGYYNVLKRIEVAVMPIEELRYENESFDFVCGEWVLHHVLIDKCIPEIHRVLKRGGRAIFLETSANNKLLIFFRKFIVGRFGIPKYQDEIEHPLTHADIRKIRAVFADHVKIYYQPYVFMKLLDNYIFRGKIRLISNILNVLDKLIYKICPILRKYSYNKVLVLSKV